MTRTHGPEFVELEGKAANAWALLPKHYRPADIQCDKSSDNQRKWCCQHQETNRTRHIQETFESPVGSSCERLKLGVSDCESRADVLVVSARGPYARTRKFRNVDFSPFREQLQLDFRRFFNSKK